MKKTCENCKEERQVKDIWIEIDKKYLSWCRSCRSNYKKDSKLLKKGGVKL